MIDPTSTGLVSYWNFDDGSSRSGLQVFHVYDRPGVYNVTLTVKDLGGLSASDVLVVTVNEIVVSGPSPWLVPHFEGVGEIVKRLQHSQSGLIEAGYLRLRINDDVVEAWPGQGIRNPGDFGGIDLLLRLRVGQLHFARFCLSRQLPRIRRVSVRDGDSLDLLDFDDTGDDLFKQWYVDGRLYYLKVIDVKKPEEGIKEIRYIDPMKMKHVRQEVKQKVKKEIQL
jgi:hypothetical protein